MESKKKETAGIVIRVVIALILFTVAVVNYDRIANFDIKGFLESIDNVGSVVAAVLVLYVIKGCIFVFPASVIYVAVGVVLDTWLAVAVNMIGIVIEVTISYFLGRFLGGDFVKRILSKKKAGEKLLNGDYQNKKWAIFTIRLIPAFPIDFVSLFFGAAKSKFPFYLLMSVLGLATRVIPFTILGDKLFELVPTDKLILVIICCIPVGVVAYLIKKFIIDKKKNKNIDDKAETGEK